MMRSLLLLTFFSLLLVGCDFSDSPTSPTREKGPHYPLAANFIGKTADGQTVQLSDFRGKVVMLDFWATWCPPCVQLMPHNQDLAERYSDRPFTIVGVSNDSELEDLNAFVDARGIHWPNIFDPDGKIIQEWKVEHLPTIHLIDDLGRIRYRNLEQADDLSVLDRMIDKLVTEAEARQEKSSS